MKKLVMLFCLALGLSVTALAEGDHSETVCSVSNAAVCAHLGHFSTINTSVEGQFMAHVMTPENAEISDFSIDLWMDMGSGHSHGSAPLEWTRVDANKYQVKNAWFVMPGVWQVRLKFNLKGQAHSLIIRLPVKP